MIEPELLSRAAVYLFAAPLIVALVELAKNVGLPSRWAPLLALSLGILTAFGTVAAIPEPPQPPFLTLLVGIALGLSAAGLYSGTKGLTRSP